MALKPNDVVGSVLFKWNAPYINSITNSQLVFELCVASENQPIALNNRGLDMALSWAMTKQGYEFCQNLTSESMRNRNGIA